MTSYSSKSSSASSPSSSCRRKFMDSTVIGYSQQQRQQRHTKKPRVVSCNFEMRIPTNALQIDMTILVSTNNDNGTPSCCYHDENEIPNTALSPPRCRPSVSYNITICKPPPPPPPRSSSLQSKDTTTTTTTTTIRWSSKFTIAKDLDENIDPFHEWNGSFTLDGRENMMNAHGLCFHAVAVIIHLKIASGEAILTDEVDYDVHYLEGNI
ncbi:hypothetical protein FRACYDRAFT_240800 [Fragilariopsis cylindrus CCMP1102]|uniref:Uncharacterized protein n=1 Tax=Fragilariopsis cylindrus CCMP1102 TaxID=635003 RepID=A0A1E7F7Y4_9STRA|nr:hypothetical protein FRACYDRAFT_240800 [Fragilariopsis cylindrus CCMP1102]|eukprot:OEU14266.1 hypothetical protein FRACYDRAFT_240800 [Fragilariopsis cylindrus CCMP1102]